MADTGMENFAATPGGATPRALWHTIQRRIAARTSLAGAQVAAIFGLLLLLQIAFGVLAPWGISLGSWWDYAHMLTLGASLAPPTLLALWAVLGPQPIAVRLPLTLWLATFLYLAIGYGEKRNGGNAADGLLFVTAWLTAFMLIQMPLWLLRAIRRWRVISLTHQPELAGTIKDAWGGDAWLPSGQFTLRALLGWTLAAAVSLAALRCLLPGRAFDVEQLPAMVAEAGFIGAMIALPGLPIVALAWLILADGRRVVLRTVLCILTVAGLAIGLGVMWLNAPDIEEACTLACIEAGAFLNGLITLGVVRACGYRLGRQPKRTDAVARLQGPSVQLPLSRWRLMVAAAPMLAVAAVLACSLPERFEMWRRADVAAQWRETGVRVIFSDEGRITSAQCGGRSVSDDDLRRIAELADLESLDLDGTSIEDQQLALLSSLTTLRSLTLSRTRITDSGLEHLTRFPELGFLDLTGTAVTDRSIQQLRQLRKLRALHLSLTDLSDAGLAALSEVPQLQVLEAELTGVSKAGAADFLKKRPRARLSYGASDALLARSLCVHKEVYESIGLGGRSIGVARIPLKLKRLHARGKAFVNGAQSTVTDTGLAALADQTELKELDLRESGVTDQGLTALAKLKSLKRLDVRGTAVTEHGAARLVRALPECQVLR